MIIKDQPAFISVKEKGMKKLLPGIPRITVGLGTCGIGNGADEVYAKFKRLLSGKKVFLSLTGCFGFCAQEPLVGVHMPGKPLVILNKVHPADVAGIAKAVQSGKFEPKKALCRVESWDHLTGVTEFGKGYESIPLWDQIPFFKGQQKTVLRDCGLINPEDIEEYIAVGGYGALFKALHELQPEGIVEEIKKSKLRGRGGAGFPTGRKWELLRQAQGDKKYIICNADEGDPGAYMNRNEIESDPHMLLEGMILGAYATGASEGVIYCRAEYPLAVKRLKLAIEQAVEYGLLGENILGTAFRFHLNVVEGAGAFVCGEETALIASIEGKAGRPRPRPPFPAQKGYLDKPTNINNVETWSNVPVIVQKGADWFMHSGTQASPGTKVFSLVGKVKNTGLVELPLGQTLHTLIYNIGGGTGTRKRVKALQSGGPSGGCIPSSLFATPIDYETLNSLGAIMGSGGMVVMDEDNCMVDVAKYFTQFTASESCGKCTPCREGLVQSLQVLNNISTGNDGTELKVLEDLGEVIKDSALCGLGQTAPNPVLTTLKYFREEYDRHIVEKRCEASVCSSLYLSPCENTCPLHMNIPAFLTMLKERKLEEAFEAIYSQNPLPASTGRICHFHCKLKCRREDIDEPVSQGEVHRYIADLLYSGGRDKLIIKKLVSGNLSSTGKKVAVVGAGPCGLTAGFFLARLGHSVELFEANREPGGILRYGIPQYRLPKRVLKREIDFIKKFGVKIHCRTKINASVLASMAAKYDAVFLATGAYKNMALGIPKEDSRGVVSGIKFLEEVAQGNKKPVIGKKVIIIGAGNVAVDAARTAWRLGSEALIVYRRQKEDMPANAQEIKEAELEGIQFMFLLAPKAIISEKGRVSGVEFTRMVPGEYDASGRRRPEPTADTLTIECDTVMLAIGEKVDSDYLSSAGVAVKRDGTAQVNPFNLATGIPKIFAGGDMVSGPATAVEAMAYGKKGADSIDKLLMGDSRIAQLAKKFDYAMKVPEKNGRCKKHKARMLGLRQRGKNFKEVSLGLTKEQAFAETLRCLRCDVK